MQNSIILSLLLLVSTVFFIACNEQGSDSVREEARESLNVPPPSNNQFATTDPNAGSTAAPVNTSGVPHYICPNNCAGSGGASAGTCPVCGSEYSHNQAYHNQSSVTPSINLPTETVVPGGSTPPIQSTTPAQNAAGVYHYTCSNGCAGGSGSAGNCATCGAALAHNTAYHNN